MRPPSRIPQSTLKQLLKLTQKKYRRSEGKFMVEGLRLVEEAIDSDWKVETLLVTPYILNSKIATGILREAANSNTAVFEVSEREAEKLSDTVASQGILAVVSLKEYPPDQIWSHTSRQSIIVALDGIADPGNAGTILRTCDWFGVDAVMINRDSVELYSPKVMRSAMGSIFHLPILPEVDLLTLLREGKKNGYQVFVTSSAEDPVSPMKPGSERTSAGNLFSGKPFPPKTIIVFGNEAHGVTPGIMKEAYERLSIPRFGKAESLNVAIACGVILGAIRLS